VSGPGGRAAGPAAADLIRQPPQVVEAAVTATLRWQELAAAGSLRVHAVFDESCLARQYGTARVMATQAGHMLALAAQPSITVQMIPLSAAGVPAVSSFTYVQSAAEHGVSAADTVLLRQLHADGRLEASRDTYRYRYAFTQLTALAASPDGTLTAIGHAQQRWATRATAPQASPPALEDRL
jgi:Domain of unknown function (DUF5753)